MLSETMQQKLADYKSIYAYLKEKLKWKVSDPRTLMMIASMYVVNNRSFDYNRLLNLSDYIKDNVGFFSTLKSYQRFTTAATLDIRFEQPHEKFQELISIYENMVARGFSRGPFTYIAALAMLSGGQPGADYGNNIERSLRIYKGMKEKHFFLTSASDYPLAVLLANRGEQSEQLIQSIEEFYQELSANGFRKGNHLQFLSHILSLEKGTDPKVLIERCIRLADAFREIGIKTKPMYYPQIGMLAMLEDGENEVKTIQIAAGQLNSERLFKWHKDMNFIISVNCLMSSKMPDTIVIETGMYPIIEAIIQAQEAAMVAIMASTAADGSSGGGDGS
ncbi:DUF4003 domain-containing protein [Peribacillus saganii]|uniref:DUF4003 domain-containing protein n=1 Tax=Peribacillus saganii TaxID=2303992 RepID=A0A372LKE4_9BACI|nr:DUF4003 family protein [Peribacillus saganii]RFU67105.1 DUF4003 domain-containing protein [Peribacillus saganii]